MLAASGLAAGPQAVPLCGAAAACRTAAEFPRPEAPQANLANNHLGYAITWFGLALTLLAVAGFYIYDLRKRR